MTDTETVRQLVIEAVKIAERIDGSKFHAAIGEFNRWLRQIKAEAWDEGKEYGERRANREIPFQLNPYREETK